MLRLLSVTSRKVADASKDAEETAQSQRDKLAAMEDAREASKALDGFKNGFDTTVARYDSGDFTDQTATWPDDTWSSDAFFF
ncbi:MAG: hypothetical protein AAF577_13020 [Pseudomonadota bacterium]